MPNRYTGRKIIRNDADIYEGLVENRDRAYIDHHKTPRLKHPTAAERALFTRVRHVWKLGDRYWKLATLHYGNPEYWWVIAWYNQKPVENMVTIGETIVIPKPLQTVLEYVKNY